MSHKTVSFLRLKVNKASEFEQAEEFPRGKESFLSNQSGGDEENLVGAERKVVGSSQLREFLSVA